MTERMMRIWIGLFVLLALVLLAGLVILVGSAPTLFKRTVLYTVRFTDAPGVTPGTPVRRSGVRIGEVRDVTLDDEEGDVRVVVAIDPKHIIRKSDEVRLIVGFLGGDVTIDFVPKPPPEPGQPPLDREPVPPGAELKGIRPPTVGSVVEAASGVVPVAQETLNEIRKSLQRLEKAAPVFEDTLKEYRELAREARGSVPNLNKTSDEFRELAKSLRQAVPGYNKTSDEVRELAKSAREAIPDLRRTGEDLGATVRTWGKLGERLDVLVQANQDKVVKTIDNLNEALTRVSSTFSESNQQNLSELLRNMRRGTSNLETISRNLEDITRDGKTSVQRLNSTLQRTDDLLKSFQGPSQDSSSNRINSILKNADESADKLNRLLTDVQEMVRVVGHADGTVSRFLTDPTMYNRIDEAVCAFTKLVPRFDHILKDFETFADKLARHPESIGLGGVVRPSAGLKDAPSYNSSHYPYQPVPVPPR
jgi:phospholipid/cholesterol/gamma-HCH transport system substrate-binding protein